MRSWGPPRPATWVGTFRAALRAGRSAGRRHFDRLLVVKGLRNKRVSEAIARASQLGVPLRFETRETLDRLSTGVPHQGIIAVVSPKPAIDVDELLKGAHDPALVVVLD